MSSNYAQVEVATPSGIKPKDSMSGFISKINHQKLDDLRDGLKSKYSDSLVSCNKVKKDFDFKKIVQCKVNLDRLAIQYGILVIVHEILKKTKPTKVALKYTDGSPYIFFWIEIKKDDFAAAKKINKIFSSRERETQKMGVSINKIITEDFFGIEIPEDYSVVPI